MSAFNPDQNQKPRQPTEEESRRARIVIGIFCGTLVLAGLLYLISGMLGLRGNIPFTSSGKAGDTQMPVRPKQSDETAPGHNAAVAPAPVPVPAPAPAPAPAPGQAPAPAAK